MSELGDIITQALADRLKLPANATTSDLARETLILHRAWLLRELGDDAAEILQPANPDPDKEDSQGGINLPDFPDFPDFPEDNGTALDNPTPPNPPAPTNPVAGKWDIPGPETEAESRARMMLWYPDIRRGGHDARQQQGYQGPRSDSLRWKPASENTGKLVVLFPSKLPIKKVYFPDGKVRTIDEISANRGNSISNSHRVTVYGDKHGSKYPAQPLVAELQNGQWMVANIVPASDKPSTPYRVQSASPFGGQSAPTQPVDFGTSENAVSYDLVKRTITVPEELVPFILRVKWIYNDGPNQGDGIADNAKPYRDAHTQYLGKGVYQIEGTAVMDLGRCGILLNLTKEINPPVHPGNTWDLSRKPGGHWGDGWYNWGAYRRYKI